LTDYGDDDDDDDDKEKEERGGCAHFASLNGT
jgi:hypothetical protein